MAVYCSNRAKDNLQGSGIVASGGKSINCHEATVGTAEHPDMYKKGSYDIL